MDGVERHTHIRTAVQSIHCAGFDLVLALMILHRPAGTEGARKATAGAAQANAKPKETTRIFAERERVCFVGWVWNDRVRMQ